MIRISTVPLRFMAQPPLGLRSLSAAKDDEAQLATTHVLIVEDEAMIAWMIEGLLEDMGFTSIAIAADGAEALRLTEELAPALIISDINLGQAPDGVETVEQIRQAVDVPVIFVSGYASVDARARIAQRVQGARVLRKPIEIEPLRLAVEAALSPPAN